MKKALILLIAYSLFTFFASSCKGKKVEISPETSSSDEALYKLGEEFLKKDIEKAQLYFRQVIDSFPKSFYAQRAKLAIADSYFKKGDEGSMILASAEYREFISLYPYSPSAAYAQYQIGMAFHKNVLKPGRDQTKTWQALAEFKKVITNYPLSEESKTAQEKIKDCEEKIAEHTFIIASQYYKENAFKAAISRLTEVLTNFPNYSKMDGVYFFMGDSYYRDNKADQGVPFFTKLISDYPKSSYALKAQDRLKKSEKKEEKVKTDNANILNANNFSWEG